MNEKRIVEVLEMIAADQIDDARRFEGEPFDGRTVAEYFGCQGAAIAALANIVKSLVESSLTGKQENDGWQREAAIQTISDYYPTDSQYPETGAIGKKLLAQAKREKQSILTWRDEPTSVLIRYAELCRQREQESREKYRQEHNS